MELRGFQGWISRSWGLRRNTVVAPLNLGLVLLQHHTGHSESNGLNGCRVLSAIASGSLWKVFVLRAEPGR